MAKVNNDHKSNKKKSGGGSFLILLVVLIFTAYHFWGGSDEKSAVKNVITDRSIPMEERITSAFKEALGESKTKNNFSVKVLDYGLEVRYRISDGFSSSWMRKGVYKDTAELMEKVKIFNKERKELGKPEFNLNVIGTFPLTEIKTGKKSEGEVIKILILPEAIDGWIKEGQIFDFNLVPDIADYLWLHPTMKD